MYSDMVGIQHKYMLLASACTAKSRSRHTQHPLGAADVLRLLSAYRPHTPCCVCTALQACLTARRHSPAPCHPRCCPVQHPAGARPPPLRCARAHAGHWRGWRHGSAAEGCPSHHGVMQRPVAGAGVGQGGKQDHGSGKVEHVCFNSTGVALTWGMLASSCSSMIHCARELPVTDCSPSQESLAQLLQDTHWHCVLTAGVVEDRRGQHTQGAAAPTCRAGGAPGDRRAGPGADALWCAQ